MDMPEEAVVVVGAGVCGMAVAHTLAKAGRKVVLIEKNHRVGGLARSYTWGDYTFDIGPHRFHTGNQEVGDYIRSILGASAISFPRKSMVHFKGQYYDWPLRPDALLKFPLRMGMRIAFDLAVNPLKRYDPESFEGYVLRQYGPTLYRHFFLDYSYKFLKLHPSETHSDWAKVGINRAIIDDKVQMRNLFEVLRSVLEGGEKDEMQFLYPRTGMQAYCDANAQAFIDAGGELHTGVEDVHVEHDGTRITEIRFEGRRIRPSQVVWTAPLHTLCGKLGVKPPDLDYLAMVMYFVEVQASLPHAFQWCYFGDKDLIFNRVSNTVHFSEELAPWGCCGLEIEVTCMKGDEVWEHPERLVDRVKEDLRRTGLVYYPTEIRDVHVERIPYTYPIYKLDYRAQLKATNDRLRGWRNLVIAGRTGQFWYNNMDHSIGKALSVAQKLLGAGAGKDDPMFGREEQGY